MSCIRQLVICCLAVVGVAACGGNGGGPDGAGGGDGSTIDAPGSGVDAVGPANCMPNPPATLTECTDCIDNDHDGRIDGTDPECTGAEDDDEGSFATGIPGDNMDPKWQDCFFDGDSGSGNDGCHYHTCCLLGSTGGADCPVDPNFDPQTDCEVAQMCVNICGPAVPPGCDCFGCCTICDDAGCETIITNPAIAPNCTDQLIHDPVACPRCTLNTDCGSPCDPNNCILCPGQDPSDLPPSCTGTECPAGSQTCGQADDPACPDGSYCANYCCVSIIE